MKKTKDDQNIGRDKESTMFCCTVVICSKDVSCHYNLVYYCMRICAFFERGKKSHMVVLLLTFPCFFSFSL